MTDEEKRRIAERFEELSRENGDSTDWEAFGRNVISAMTFGRFGLGTKGLYGMLAELIGNDFVPEGVEWPKFEDGEPVGIGDKFVDKRGLTSTAHSIEFSGECCKIKNSVGTELLTTSANGDRVKRPPSDSWWKWRKEAEYSSREYVESVMGKDVSDPEIAMSMKVDDLERRARKLCEGETK